jgi:hypothetical protein
MNAMRQFDYSHVSNDNDMSNTSRRNPIRVIDHYGSGTTARNSNTTNNNSSNYQAQQHVSSRNSPISIKIETHSPVHLKSTSNLYESTTTSSSGASSFQQQQQQHNQNSPSHDQKFNGRSNCSPQKLRPLLLYLDFFLVVFPPPVSLWRL